MISSLAFLTWSGCQSTVAQAERTKTVTTTVTAAAPPNDTKTTERKTQRQNSPLPPTAASGEVPSRIPIVEEEMQVSTKKVEGNRVRIMINPVETPVTESVPVKREQVVVERIPVREGDQSITDYSFQPKTFEVTAMTEIPTATIQPVMTNMVTVRKQEVVRNQTVEDTLKGTKAEVTREPQSIASADITPVGRELKGSSAGLSAPLMLPSAQSVTYPFTFAEVKQRLVIDKREVPSEKVRISIQPTERNARETVQLRDEVIVIERTPHTEMAGGVPNGTFAPQSIEVTMMKEVPVVEKRQKVKEWLTIRKEDGQEQRMVESKLKETNLALVVPEE
ncbi:MAG: hypothetical protein A4E19_13825 [Nitrospira sp. SG-bin1]|nr:MAG: hypothetical protein A4E19_13825 [Nitrospira sp. SG-bin1]